MCALQVQEPLEAEGLLESMKTTYDKFEPNKSSVMERSLERLFGEVSKGNVKANGDLSE